MRIHAIRIFGTNREISFREGDRYQKFTIKEFNREGDDIYAYGEDGEVLFSISTKMVLIEYVDTYNPIEHTSAKDYKDDPTWQPEKPKPGYNKTRTPGEKAPSVQFDPSSPPCPDCGKPLLRRKGKFGEFWGCTAFPNCRYTKNIKSTKDVSPAAQAIATVAEKMESNKPETKTTWAFGGAEELDKHFYDLKSKHLAHHDTEDFGLIDENGLIETLDKKLYF